MPGVVSVAVDQRGPVNAAVVDQRGPINAAAMGWGDGGCGRGWGAPGSDVPLLILIGLHDHRSGAPPKSRQVALVGGTRGGTRRPRTCTNTIVLRMSRGHPGRLRSGAPFIYVEEKVNAVCLPDVERAL